MTRSIQTVEDVLRLLDSMFESEADRWTDRGARWWDGFYDDRSRGVPFFRPVPDESLVTWHHEGRLRAPAGGRALDLGCGPGRNAVWLAQQGYRVDALDLSPAALDWGRERADEAGVEVDFVRASIFDWDVSEPAYDLVYDSGCFHHLPPHRRISYRSLLERTLAPGGAFGLACFAAGAMGSEDPDDSFYRAGRLSGGLAYTDADLRSTFGWLTEVELRRMRQMPPDSELFGEAFLWAGLFRRQTARLSDR
ncbi:MAG TPA: class I SAM-dependent methyltransferase [Actinomycetes bacterium]